MYFFSSRDNYCHCYNMEDCVGSKKVKMIRRDKFNLLCDDVPFTLYTIHASRRYARRIQSEYSRNPRLYLIDSKTFVGFKLHPTIACLMQNYKFFTINSIRICELKRKEFYYTYNNC